MVDNQCHVCMCINLCSKNHLPSQKALCSSRMQRGKVGRKLKIEDCLVGELFSRSRPQFKSK